MPTVKSEVISLLWWLLPAILLVVLLFLACYIPPIKELLKKPGENAKPLWAIIAPQVVLGVLGFLGGIVALWQFDRTHRQREEQFLRKTRQDDRHAARRQEQERRLAYVRQRQERKLANARQKQDREIAEAKAAQDKLTTMRKEIQDQYVDIQNRLSSPEPIIRANAALRLGEFAKEPIARTTAERGETPTLALSETNYPYFVPAVSQLATALYLEFRTESREAIKKALEQLTKFAKTEAEQPLIYPLISQLREANRTAKQTFIEALAVYSVAMTEQETRKLTGWSVNDNQIESTTSGLHLNFVASVAPFCDKPEMTILCLKDLLEEGKRWDFDGKVTMEATYVVQCMTHRQTRLKQTAEEQKKGDAQALPGLRIAARQLIDTRDSLATVLRALKPPAGFPEPFLDTSVAVKQFLIDQTDDRGEVTSTGWKRQRSVSLSGAFLAGADLFRAYLQGAELDSTHLQGARLTGAFLQGTVLYKAHLQGADLMTAQLHGAYLSGAFLMGAYLTRARLQGADLSRAYLQGAELDSTHLQGAGLDGAQLQNANLFKARLQGANLFGAHLQGANLSEAQLDKTKVCAIVVQERDSEQYLQTNFKGSSWGDADFSQPSWMGLNGAAERMKPLKEWLQQFPPMPAEDVIPYEAKPEPTN